ncbi:MAG: HTH-type transcriptional activator RhaS [Enterobacteriaceae bacterium]
MLLLRCSDFFSSQQVPIAIEPRAPQVEFSEHHHDFYEIVLVEQGAGIHVFNGQPHTLSGGCVCFVRDRDHHLFERTEQLYLTNVLFRAPDAFRFLSGVGQLLPRESDGIYPAHWRVSHQVMQQVLSLVEQMAQIPAHLTMEELALYESLFMQLLVTLRIGGMTRRSDDAEGRLYQLLEWLQENYADKVEWQELAQRFGLPLRTLHRQLKNRTGMTPQRYHTRLRLLQARQQLCHSDDSVTDIAYRCGFSDSNHFSTLFRREFALSPRDYRQHRLRQN